MKALKSNGQLLKEGRQYEGAGQMEDAAAAYQRVVDADPRNQQAVERLLVVYRKLKDYRKELAVIDAALTAAQQKDKSAQQKWIDTHPGAARLGKAVLRQLGGESATAFGTDPQVEKLLKRRSLVEKRIGGRTTTKKKKPAIKKASPPPAERKSSKADDRKKEAAAAKKAAAVRKAEAARQAEEARKEKAGVVRQAREEKAEQVRQAREAKAELARQKKEERAEAARIAKEEKAEQARPSLFVVSIRYLVALEKIDAAMSKHMAFLDKHFAAGHFLVAGRQVPRTGGIIIARGKDRGAIERIMKQDPFVKGRLASFDIVEFVASRAAKELKLR